MITTSASAERSTDFDVPRIGQTVAKHWFHRCGFEHENEAGLGAFGPYGSVASVFHEWRDEPREFASRLSPMRLRKAGWLMGFGWVAACSSSADAPVSDTPTMNGTSTDSGQTEAENETLFSPDGEDGTSSEISGTGSGASSNASTGGVEGSGTGADDLLARCPSIAWFCEDFEQLAVGEFQENEDWALAINRNIPGDRELNVGETHVRSGSRALQAVTLAGVGIGEAWRNFISHNIGEHEEPIFGRVYVYIDHFGVKPQQGNNTHWWMVEHHAIGSFNGSADDASHRVRLFNGTSSNSDPSTTSFALNYDMSGMPEQPGPSILGQEVRAGEWLCVEWVYDSTQPYTGVRREGELLVETFSTIGAWSLPPTQSVRFGMAVHPGDYTTGFEAWFDDFALASERLPCEDPGD